MREKREIHFHHEPDLADGVGDVEQLGEQEDQAQEEASPGKCTK